MFILHLQDKTENKLLDRIDNFEMIARFWADGKVLRLVEELCIDNYQAPFLGFELLLGFLWPPYST